MSFLKKQKSIKKNTAPASDANKKASGGTEEAYFREARSWHDDIFTNVLVSRNRYKAAFLGAVGLSGLLAVAVVMMLPLQKIELVVVHQNSDGYVWVTTTKPSQKFSHTEAQVKAEIANYVELRESYDPASYYTQGKLVKYFSSEDVENQFLQYQTDPNAPIQTLGKSGTRQVSIQGINLLSSDQIPQGITQSSNVALVTFTVKDTQSNGGVTSTPYQALISWTWQGEPTDQEASWQNYDGFTITEYQVNPVAVSN